MTAREPAEPARLRRGELARRAGCNAETVRYYERIGLLPAPARTAAGHRVYGPADIRRLAFVRRARAMGFGLEEIRDLLGDAAGRDDACRRARTVTRRQIDAVRRRIADLRTIERTLESMATACETAEGPSCPVIERLSEPDR